ncbi:MAG TPA: hypothetical protein VHR66_25650 [Gemmataceae bacterium]|jgi:hypothetical protein|nr:hypothetical protein [Gemmataceae bacterium]
MSKAQHLNQLFSVSPRFSRSVSLSRDAWRSNALDGYILTPAGREVLRRLASALSHESPTRAWSITGPYGSGKSAFALFVAQLLGGEETVRATARKFLAAADAPLGDHFFGPGGPLPKKAGRLCPVLVTGSRQPIEKALASALASSLRSVAQRGRPPQIIERLERLAKEPTPSGTTIVGLFEEANDYLDRFGTEAAGILLIVDELGKFLEFEATNPAEGDVFVLQELAEAAARSKRPFLFLTILHQALDRYADHMSPRRRAEWAKVQGRFEDVAFEERSEQILRLIAQAIRPDGADRDLKPARRQAKNLANEAVSLGVRCGGMNQNDLQNCLAECYPLHPLTSLVLGPLFRLLAQNERSLFAFLASSEPFGFQEFLRDTVAGDDAFRLDRLYDYIMTSLGPALFAQHRGKVWADVQTALDRLHDASDLEIRLAKTIGLLQAVGAASGIPASSGVLHAAFKSVGSHNEIDQALQSLTTRSVVVFRRHTGSYGLWEGSDIDLDARLVAARQAVERDQSLAAFLTRQFPAQPLIARRHYFQTGTFRYFDACYADRTDLQADLFNGVFSGDLLEADGRVAYCLPRDPEDRTAICRLIQTPADQQPIIVALPQDVFELREMCHELVCLRWVAGHTPELENDRTARRELGARLAIAEENLRSHIAWLFSPANTGCVWYHRGTEVSLTSQRHLNDLLSRACDEVYTATPKWRNELVNRRELSSAAAAARRNLIEAMFEHSDQEALGFEGTPPERSIYETLLRGSRLHRSKAGEWGIHVPDAKAEPAVRQMWKAIDAFLADTEAGRKSVAQLFDILRRPPFGLKDGVLPVILAAVLVEGHTQVALYEEGSFVPRPNAAVFERLFRAAEKYELQRFRIAGPRAEVFQQYAGMLSNPGDNPDLLTIVRPMVRLVRDLPEYVGKTKQISETAQRALKVVREARQPDRLLFTDLPTACGFPPFEAAGKIPADQVEGFFKQLRQAFTDLQHAYPRLLSEIERLVLHAFGETGQVNKARPRIAHHAKLVLNVAVEAKLKAFLLRVSDDSTDDRTWLESLSTLLAGKPPVNWDDQDRARFEVQLAAAARTFDHYRVLALEMEKTGYALLDGDKSMLLVSITAPDRGEVEKVVQVPPEFSPQARRAGDELRRVLREQKLLDKKDLSVAVLAELARQLLSEGD